GRASGAALGRPLRAREAGYGARAPGRSSPGTGAPCASRRAAHVTKATGAQAGSGAVPAQRARA
ncbi:hypothetical protein, partial [Streptomyces sp. TRM49041]|uniref:hypothetical protein n=1 Tax=Streptomyces sp. TRM49041 TaxID=2603216 RepID=UPI001CA3ABEA